MAVPLRHTGVHPPKNFTESCMTAKLWHGVARPLESFAGSVILLDARYSSHRECVMAHCDSTSDEESRHSHFDFL